MEGLKNTTENLSLVNLRTMKLGPPDYETGLLTADRDLRLSYLSSS
jgi:hypothetical protein